MEVRSGAREEAKGKTENKDVVPGGGRPKRIYTVKGWACFAF